MGGLVRERRRAGGGERARAGERAAQQGWSVRDLRRQRAGEGGACGGTHSGAGGSLHVPVRSSAERAAQGAPTPQQRHQLPPLTSLPTRGYLSSPSYSAWHICVYIVSAVTRVRVPSQPKLILCSKKGKNGINYVWMDFTELGEHNLS